PLGAARVEARRARLLVSPRVLPAVRSARREFPLGFGGKAPILVGAVADGAREIDTVDGMIGALFASRVAERAVHLHLPRRDVFPIDLDRRPLALADVRARLVLLGRDLVLVDAERRQRDLVRGLFVGVAVVGAHEEFASGNSDHVGWAGWQRERRDDRARRRGRGRDRSLARAL